MRSIHVTASAHIGHRRRTGKDEGQKKAAGQTGTGTKDSLLTLSDEEPDYSNTAMQEACNDKRPPHGTQSDQTGQEKRIS